MVHDLAVHETRMNKAVGAFQRDLVAIRAGKASASLLDGIQVDYYGVPTPLNQVASISVPEARLLVVQPWEKPLLKDIARAIMAADLGLNPQDDGSVLKIPIPQLNEDRRKELVKQAHKMAEEGRVAVRSVRRDANDELKKLQKAGDISEDDARRSMDQVQKMHDKYIAEIEEVLKKKEAEVMEV
jgi:ribosome recycling factor